MPRRGVVEADGVGHRDPATPNSDESPITNSSFLPMEEVTQPAHGHFEYGAEDDNGFYGSEGEEANLLGGVEGADAAHTDAMEPAAFTGNVTFQNDDSNYPEGSPDAAEEDANSPKVPLTSHRSWYSSAKRRDGRGAERRNELMSRTVCFIGLDDPEGGDTDDEGSPKAGRGKGTTAGGDSQDSSGDSESGSGEGFDGYCGPTRATFADQLFAVLERSARQVWRSKLDLLLDLVVPLLFIVVSIALWAIWGSEERVEESYFSSDQSSYLSLAAGLHAPYIRDYVCIEQPDGTTTLPEFIRCSSTPLATGEVVMQSYVCDGDNSMVPLPAGYTVCRGEFEWQRVLSAAFLQYWGWLSAVPSLDVLIQIQWAALAGQKTIREYITNTMAELAYNTRYSAALCSGYLYFVGSQSPTSELITYMSNTSGLFEYVSEPTVYASVTAAQQAAKASKRRVWAVIELKQIDSAGLDVVLHMNNSALPTFATVYNSAYSGGVLFDTAELYLLSGFSTLQQLVSEFYLNHIHSAEMNMTQLMVSNATPKNTRIPLLIQARAVLPLIFALAFLYSVSQQTKRLVLEKELRIREAMLIMGLKQWTLYVSEFVMQVAMFVPTCVMCVILLKVTYVTKSDPLLLFLIFFLFALTTIPLSGMLAAFFSKSRLASLVAPVVYFILVVPMFAMANAEGAAVTAVSVFSPSGFAAAMNVFLLHESGSGCGVGQLRSTSDNPPLQTLLGMLLLDFGVYYLLMLYLDAVMPKDWGTPKHPLFFVKEPLKWCTGSTERVLEGGEDGRAEDGVFESEEYNDDVVRFDGLRKEYSRDGNKFVAVNNLYWGMREGEISVLLGHNGAGKTTVLNMMTGMIEPDEGDCYIYGDSVRTAKADVRQQVGYCPQHNILWEELTCRDHLEFFGKIKGLKGWELEDAMCCMLYETDLLDKMDQSAKSLSGGMKRKLSIAIAFVGGSRLVFLDEPTAGLDVGARRHIWELLKRMAHARTLLLTTHYMDEADLLGSRIGIMSHGRLKCTGSSLFLKSRLGVGYSIVISVDPALNPDAVDEVVLDTVDGAKVLNRHGCELTYQLPVRSASQFPALLNEIDSADADGIRGYTLAATTLEEVFLKVSEEDDENRREAIAQEDIELIWHCETATVASSVLLLQFKAMLWKRVGTALRDRKMQCFQIVCPVVCILIAMLLNLIQFRAPQSMAYTYDMFSDQSNPVLESSYCDVVWGSAPTTNGFTVHDTRYQNAMMVSDYMLDTWYVHRTPRYGGVSCADLKITAALQQSNNWRGNNVNVFLYNSSSYHQAALNLATYYDLFLKYFLSSQSVFMRYTATLFKRPSGNSQLGFIFISALIMIPFTFLPSNPVAWVVKERQCGSRHLQNLCGLNFFVYWVSNFVFDMTAYVITMLLCILIFAIFQRTEFVGASRLGGTVVLFLVYGCTSTVAAYALSFLFKEHSSAQTIVMGVSFVSGFLLLMLVYVLTLDPDKVSTSDKMRWGFRLVPSYCIGEGISSMLMLDSKIAIGTATSVWDMDQLGWPLTYMLAEFPVLWLVTLVVDHPAVGRLAQMLQYRRDAEPSIPSDEDSDVEDERDAVYEALQQDGPTSDVVRVVNLHKRYGKNVAVKGITFSIFPGEVFGFLGTNGAGKTTTISMLCQQFLPTGGSAFVCGYDIVMDSREALQCVGYCPQFDATIDMLTVEEHLVLYAGIRGIVPAYWSALVDALCSLCDLTLYRKTVSSALSGGNRRKLSVAISLVGGPQVIFLDEPSAGMDPVARRAMWTAIQRAAGHSSVVLTTHHLEEVEALADIVAIMVRGYVRCIGDKVHLKNKFGSGLEVSVRLSSEQYAEDFVSFMKEEFPDSVMNEGTDRRFVYQLPRGRSFGDIFKTFQHNKKRLHITDYSVSQTSIEQVFLQIRQDASSLQ